MRHIDYDTRMETVSVYQYQSAIEYLKDAIAEKKRSDESFSIRRFCKQIGFGSHAYLVMILNGRRSLTLKQVPSLATGLSLNSDERIFFQTLIQLENAGSEDEKNLVKLWLNGLNPKPEYRIVEVEQYHLIANWIHMAILTLAKIEGAKITPENIYEMIHKKIPLALVREATERLLNMGLLKEQDGKILPCQNSVRTKDDVSSKGAREYHRQVAKLAIDATEEQDPSIREFQSFALTVPEGKINLAKDMIRKFRHQFVQVMESEPGYEVYQCNLQFFKLVESPSTLKKTQRSTVNDSEMKSSKRSNLSNN